MAHHYDTRQGLFIKHGELFSTRTDMVAAFLLENPEYLRPKRGGDLETIIMEMIGCRRSQAYIYIREARREINKLGKDREKVDQAFQKVIRDLEYVMQKGKELIDRDGAFALKEVRQSIIDRAKLYGLVTDNIKHSGEITEKIQFLDDVKE